uniref:Tenascin-X n=1 Tax=Apteryx owenii TaxID=8824 RepID=A0A8B9QLW0_APTOW
MVQYKDAQGQPQVLPVDGESHTVTVPDLVPSRRYKFNVYGMWGPQHALYYALSIAAPVPPEEEQPSQPRLGELTASHVTPTSVQLDWTVPEGTFDSFTVQYKDAQGQPQVLPVDGKSRTVTVPDLVPSRRYKFNMYGVWGRKRLGPISTDAVTGEGGCGHWKDGQMDGWIGMWMDGWVAVCPHRALHCALSIAALAPSQEEPPSQPRLGELTASHVTPTSVQLEWTVPEGTFDSFTVQYKDAQGQPQVLPVDGGSRTVTVPDLVPSHLYKFNLYGMWGQKRLGPIYTDAVTGEVGSPLPFPYPRDCAEEQLNGPGPSRETLVFLGGDPEQPLRVFCDMETDGGGWLVFQRRMNGLTDFWRGWAEYARGFGNLSQEFWLGNEALHALTRGRSMELRVDLRTPDEAAFARYRDFAVAGPEDDFRLHLGAYSGTAGDALGYHAGNPFSTRDRDPRGRPRPCAVSYTGAWWYRNCHYANLNGRYGNPRDHQGINWFPWKGFEFSIPFTEMKLRPQRD